MQLNDSDTLFIIIRVDPSLSDRNSLNCFSIRLISDVCSSENFLILDSSAMISFCACIPRIESCVVPGENSSPSNIINNVSSNLKYYWAMKLPNAVRNINCWCNNRSRFCKEERGGFDITSDWSFRGPKWSQKRVGQIKSMKKKGNQVKIRYREAHSLVCHRNKPSERQSEGFIFIFHQIKRNRDEDISSEDSPSDLWWV